MWFIIYTLLYTIIMLIPSIYYLFVMAINFYLQLSRDSIIHNFVLFVRSDFIYTYVSHYCVIACLYLLEMTKLRRSNNQCY